MEKKVFKPKKGCIIITGPESSGKTTLALRLAKKYKGKYNSEFARDYVLNLKRAYNYQDICLIAEEQKKQFHANQTNKSELPVFIDTYLIITKVWMEWNCGKYEPWMDNEIRQTKNCLYLLCAPDIQWVEDGVRENSGAARYKLFKLYQQELLKYGLGFKIVKGHGHSRIESAEKIVKEYLSNVE